MIERINITQKVTGFESTGRHLPLPHARLTCGHTQWVILFEGAYWQVSQGRVVPKHRSEFEGVVVDVGSAIVCDKCTDDDLIARLKARPKEKATRFKTREELQSAYPQARWHEYGPVHRHGDKYYVQVYLGQHEYLAFNVDDIHEVWNDPGYNGVEHGWAYLTEDNVTYVSYLGTLGTISAPEQA